MFTKQEIEFIGNVLANLKFQTQEVQQHILAAGICEKIGKSLRQEPEGITDATEDAEGNAE